jgi:hypothetical protein
MVADYKMLTLSIMDAVKGLRNPDDAKILMFGAFTSALDQAKKDRNGFGWSSSGEVLAAVTLDEANKRLLHAEFYVKAAEYRDEELFKDA